MCRISASSSNLKRLRDSFERLGDSYKDQPLISEKAEVDGHAAANVLKQFFRLLPEPLIPDEVIKLHLKEKCVSDETFATNVR